MKERRMGQLKMAFENDFPNRQTIDRESGAYLKFEGGTPERGIERFSFHWKGETMKFYAKDDSYGGEKGKWQPNIHWTFFNVDIPEHMQDQREEIGNMIKQVLEAHGYAYDRESFKDVSATFNPP